MPSNRITIAAQWAEFSRKVFQDRKPGPIQYQEMRRAFYAGVAGMIEINLQIASVIDDDEEGVKALKAVTKEVEDFAMEIRRGNA
jgi:hypothetical protein